MDNQGTPSAIKQFLATVSVCLGAFSAGSGIGWSSPVQRAIQNGSLGFTVNDEDYSYIGSFATLGATAACIPCCLLMQNFGRKFIMLLSSFPFLFGFIVIACARDFEDLLLGRFMVGTFAGSMCVGVPIYTTEIAHVSWRGTFGCFFQLWLVGGILFSFVLGAYMKEIWLNVACICSTGCFGLLFILMPETPTYLVQIGDYEEALRTLKWLRGKNYDCTAEMKALIMAKEKVAEKSMNFRARYSQRIVLKAFSITAGLMIFQQLSGINAIVFYSTDLFRGAKTGISSKMSSIIVGILMVVASLVPVFVIDFMGRRCLLLISSVFMTTASVCLGIYFSIQQSKDEETRHELLWLPLSSVCLFLTAHSFGFGAIPWFYMVEIFTEDVKLLAVSAAATINWFIAFLVTSFFLPLENEIGRDSVFYVFASSSLIGALFVIIYVPETKKKTLSEIQEIMEN